MNSSFITSGLDVYTSNISGGTPESLLLYNDYNLNCWLICLFLKTLTSVCILFCQISFFFILFDFEESCKIGNLI